VNAREQLLKKRVESLEGQLQASLELLGRVLGENEYLASVACAFAWDLAGDTFGDFYTDAVGHSMLDRWTSAVEEASK
jgi:hypothetical protein